MQPVLNEITEKALTLTVDDRAVLARCLWDSIEGEIDPEVEKVWLKEAEKRWLDIEKGNVVCVQAEEAMKIARERLKK